VITLEDKEILINQVADDKIQKIARALYNCHLKCMKRPYFGKDAITGDKQHQEDAGLHTQDKHQQGHRKLDEQQERDHIINTYTLQQEHLIDKRTRDQRYPGKDEIVQVRHDEGERQEKTTTRGRHDFTQKRIKEERKEIGIEMAVKDLECENKKQQQPPDLDQV
jgi:hypothetical protein